MGKLNKKGVNAMMINTLNYKSQVTTIIKVINNRFYITAYYTNDNMKEL